MARGQRRTIEEKIAEKEGLVAALRTRLKSEQNELEALYKEKRDKDLEGISQLLDSSGLNVDEASDILQEYIRTHSAGEESA